ncbi:uncharacterized protein RJT21DRAFT_25465 [Scheffersomyces amazonensis]|uniref:uncharacterized protein n=1 Tax=Scheffersomyces amazonensis TaxID=1078765 RepID=UPI00315DB432
MITQQQSDSLTNEFYILHLLYYRSKNQHHQSVWWKYLDIIHRKVRTIIKLAIDIRRIKSTSKQKQTQKYSQIIHLIHHLTKVFPKAYYEFNTIISLGQFISLGFTLVALVCKLSAILSDIAGTNSKLIPIASTTVSTTVSTATATATADDLGEEITYEPLQPTLPDPQTQTTKSISKPKTKAKKKKSSKKAIDDIFGGF